MVTNWVSGYFGATCLERRLEQEADGDDRVVAFPREGFEHLLALLIRLDLEFAELHSAILFREALGAVIGGLVEGLVEFGADVIDDRRLDFRLRLGLGRRTQTPPMPRAM